MAKIKGLKAKVEKHPQYNVPRRIYDIESHSSKEDPQLIAESMLKKVAPDLKISPDLSQLKFDKVKKSILGSHVLYQQQHKGKPISGAWVRVDIDKEGRVYNINNDLVPETIIEKSKKKEERTKEKLLLQRNCLQMRPRIERLKQQEPLVTAPMKCWITSWFIFPTMVFPL